MLPQSHGLKRISLKYGIITKQNIVKSVKIRVLAVANQSKSVSDFYCLIWDNDYDNYRLCLHNIGNTNRLTADIRSIVVNSPKDKRIIDPERSLILKRALQEEKETAYVDYITLSGNVLFSMKYVQSYEALEKETLYNCVRNSPYVADNYLDGLIIESADYKEVFSKYKTNSNVIFLVDPPYLSTETGTYKNYRKLKDYFNVLDVLDGTNYIYFTLYV